jgi:peptide deformylase
MYRKVVEWPHSSLKKNSLPLTKGDSNSCIEDLIDTFNVTGGLGLAAPQIGIPGRAIVISPVNLGLSTDNMLVMINPSLELSGEIVKSEEACFSVPFVSAYVKRHSHCVVTYYNQEWEKRELALDGMASICVQHEVDHLDGKLYLDRVGRLTRSALAKKIKKQRKKIEQAEKVLLDDFEKDHAELHTPYGINEKKKTTHSRKRKPKPRRKVKRNGKKR